MHQDKIQELRYEDYRESEDFNKEAMEFFMKDYQRNILNYCKETKSCWVGTSGQFRSGFIPQKLQEYMNRIYECYVRKIIE